MFAFLFFFLTLFLLLMSIDLHKNNILVYAKQNKTKLNSNLNSSLNLSLKSKRKEKLFSLFLLITKTIHFCRKLISFSNKLVNIFTFFISKHFTHTNFIVLSANNFMLWLLLKNKNQFSNQFFAHLSFRFSLSPSVKCLLIQTN